MSDHLQKLADGPKRKWLEGRGGRREYWVFGMPLMLVGTVLTVVVSGDAGMSLVVRLAFGIGFLLFMIRRLHDLGRTGWFAPLINIGTSVLVYVLKGFMPAPLAAVGALVVTLGVLITLGVLPGDVLGNAYGPPPGGRKSSAEAEVFT